MEEILETWHLCGNFLKSLTNQNNWKQSIKSERCFPSSKQRHWLERSGRSIAIYLVWHQSFEGVWFNILQEKHHSESVFILVHWFLIALSLLHFDFSYHLFFHITKAWLINIVFFLTEYCMKDIWAKLKALLILQYTHCYKKNKHEFLNAKRLTL